MKIRIQEIKFGLGESDQLPAGQRWAALVWFFRGNDEFFYVLGLRGYLLFVLWMPWFLLRRRFVNAWERAQHIVDQRWPD